MLLLLAVHCRSHYMVLNGYEAIICGFNNNNPYLGTFVCNKKCVRSITPYLEYDMLAQRLVASKV